MILVPLRRRSFSNAIRHQQFSGFFFSWFADGVGGKVLERGRDEWKREKERGKDIQVGEVDGGVDFLGEVVGEKAAVVEGPAEDVVQEQDRGVFVGAGDVAVQTADFGGPAAWGAVPGEPGDAAGGHFLGGFVLRARGFFSFLVFEVKVYD